MSSSDDRFNVKQFQVSTNFVWKSINVCWHSTLPQYHLSSCIIGRFSVGQFA